MNIKLIKSEIERLVSVTAEWNESQAIDAIERDLALDKVKKIYELLRFGEATAAAQAEPSIEPTAAVAAIVAEAVATNIVPTEQSNESENEKEVEVEFLFDEEDDNSTPIAIEESEPTDDNDIEVELVFAEEDEESEEEQNETIAPINIEQSEPEVAINDEPKEETVVNIPVAAPIAEPEQAPAPKPEQAPEPEPEPVAPKPVAKSTNNLFGMEEVRRPRGSKHQRMMSIYSDSATEKSHEKPVDISKIFDFGLDTDVAEPATERKSASFSTPATVADTTDRSVTLGDVMAQNNQTLADTIATPSALAEEITLSKISKLSQGVGINDMFLMIRDLFDGDDEAYNQTIHELDNMDSFDDCMIYIAENFEWNPDSEGAKFIMQLLERKYL